MPLPELLRNSTLPQGEGGKWRMFSDGLAGSIAEDIVSRD